jgi:hypothetical protein
MTGIAVEITKYVDDSFPGFVECCFVDAWGTVHSIVEKIPVVTLAHLHANSSYPQPAVIACQIIDRRKVGNRDIAMVDTEFPWHIESIVGESRFEMLKSQLVEFDWSSGSNPVG